MSKDCPRCGTPNASDARFCRACGAALTVAATVPAEPPLPCRACGHPNLAGARFCAQCGSDQTRPRAPLATPAAIPPGPRRPMGLWIGLAGVVVALAAGGAWWINQARSPATPTFDVTPPPAVSDASSPGASAGASPETPAPAAAPPLLPLPVPAATTPAPTASAAVSDLWEPAAKSAATAEPAEKEQRAAKDKAARDAKVRALREQRQLAASQAEGELARRRAEDARALPAAPVPRAAAPLPAPPRSVQARCAGRNPVLQGLCEARECIRRENANDAVCERIRADAEQRRQQN